MDNTVVVMGVQWFMGKPFKTDAGRNVLRFSQNIDLQLGVLMKAVPRNDF